jgi:hypothetical protein
MSAAKKRQIHRHRNTKIQWGCDLILVSDVSRISESAVVAVVVSL